MEEELTDEVEMAKRRIDEINMELNQVHNAHTMKERKEGDLNRVILTDLVSLSKTSCCMYS